MTLLLIVHILLAISSLALSLFTLFYPSQKKLKESYALGFLTLLSGTFLVLLKHVNLASVCVSGLGYLAAMYFGLSMAQKKLAKN